MDTESTIFEEQLRAARECLDREHERLQEQMDRLNAYRKILEMNGVLLEKNERLMNEVEQQKAEIESLRQQLDDKDMKLNEMNKFSVNMAKKSSQEGIEKAIRIYVNTSRRKTQAKREVARAQLLDLIATAKLDMPEDIMEALNHLDDEQPEPAPVGTTVNVQAGGINVQQANTVVK